MRLPNKWNDPNTLEDLLGEWGAKSIFINSYGWLDVTLKGEWAEKTLPNVFVIGIDAKEPIKIKKSANFSFLTNKKDKSWSKKTIVNMTTIYETNLSEEEWVLVCSKEHGLHLFVSTESRRLMAGCI